MAAGYKQTYWPMEQTRIPRNKTCALPSFDLFRIKKTILSLKLADKQITSGLWASNSLSIKRRGYDRPGQLSFGCLLSMPGGSLWPPGSGSQPALTVSGYLGIGLSWILCIIPSWFLGASKAENCGTKWLTEALWTQVSLILIGDADDWV